MLQSGVGFNETYRIHTLFISWQTGGWPNRAEPYPLIYSLGVKRAIVKFR